VASSILNDVKKIIGMDASYTAFDIDVIIHINTVFVILKGLGIGPTTGFQITGNTETWDAFTGTDLDLNAVKTYIALRVQMIFDPPSASFVIEARNKVIQELEVRMSITREGESWTDPNPPPVPAFPAEDNWWEWF
jgi:hypothetical protein